jgi:hypothetical protein
MTNLWVETEELGDYSESDYAYDAVKTASYLLWAMSGRKFTGTTTVTERYVSAYDPYLRVGGSYLTFSPTLVNGSIQNIPNAGYGRHSHRDFLGDGTSSYSRLRLRGRKVIKVHNLRDINGNVIDPKHYYLYDHSTLLGTPNSTWEPSNIEVTYTYGTPPPTAGRAAARVLATELVKLYENDDTCALPQRVTSITRQGVSYTILDNQSFIDELKTGIYAVDLFLKTANPDKARARSRVFSPDVPRARRITGKSPAFELSAFDLYFNVEGGSNTYYVTEFGGEFLLSDPSWSIVVTLSNYDGSVTQTLEDRTELNTDAQTIVVGLSYNEILGVLGPRDPGTIDLYASRPGLVDPSVEEVINLVTGNVIYQLGDRVTPVVLV